MCERKHPFVDLAGTGSLINNILNKDYPKINKNFPTYLNYIIDGSLDKNPNSRFDIKKILKSLQKEHGGKTLQISMEEIKIKTLKTEKTEKIQRIAHKNLAEGTTEKHHKNKHIKNINNTPATLRNNLPDCPNRHKQIPVWSSNIGIYSCIKCSFNYGIG